jgi:hypothetical protein
LTKPQATAAALLLAKQTVVADKVANVSLDGLEGHRATCLAFEMVDDSSQSLELDATAAVGTVVQDFPVLV